MGRTKTLYMSEESWERLESLARNTNQGCGAVVELFLSEDPKKLKDFQRSLELVRSARLTVLGALMLASVIWTWAIAILLP